MNITVTVCIHSLEGVVKYAVDQARKVMAQVALGPAIGTEKLHVQRVTYQVRRRYTCLKGVRAADPEERALLAEEN